MFWSRTLISIMISPMTQPPRLAINVISCCNFVVNWIQLRCIGVGIKLVLLEFISRTGSGAELNWTVWFSFQFTKNGPELNQTGLWQHYIKFVSFSILSDILLVESSPGFCAVSGSSFSGGKGPLFLISWIPAQPTQSGLLFYFRKAWRYMDAYYR